MTNNSSDPLHPDNLRLSQSFVDEVGATRVLHTVRVRKPDRQWFIRVHPSPDYRVDAAVIELNAEREIYVVAPDLADSVGEEVSVRRLLTATSRTAGLFLWPLKLPPADGRINPWTASALEAAAEAETRWVRVASNMPAGCYDVYRAGAELPEPEWPSHSFAELIKIAFRERFISSADHPVLRRLRGEL